MYMNDDGFWLFREILVQGGDQILVQGGDFAKNSPAIETRLQALVAESSEGHTHHTRAIAHHRVNRYFVALDIVNSSRKGCMFSPISFHAVCL